MGIPDHLNCLLRNLYAGQEATVRTGHAQKLYKKELYKKDLYDPDYHNGVITHLETDILECEVKWALGSKQS